MIKWNKQSFEKENIKKVEAQYKDYVVEKPEMVASQIKIDDNKSINLAGLQVTDTGFSGLLNPICKYAFAKMVNEMEKPIFFTSNSFSKYPGTCEITTDVDKTETVYDNACAIYNDKIVTISESYGTVSVACYAKDKPDTKKFIEALNHKMIKENQYRGKCLFFADSSVIFRDTPAVGWDDVVMAKKHKDEIKTNTVDFLTNPKFSSLGINTRGIILHGPPGTGKTMMVKSLFNSMKDTGITRVYATADTFTYADVVTQLFDFLKFTGKTILAFEDMDLISPERSDGSGRKVLGALLNSLDGIRKIADPLVVIGTTNDVSMLDRALANRPCRFDRKIEVPLPDPEQTKIFYSMLTKSEVNNDVVELSKGFSGAHIKEAVNTAKLLSIQTGLDISSCLKDACHIIRENFFPMTKEASGTLYKNENNGLKKEAQIALITPLLNNPIGAQYTIIPLLNFFKRPSEYGNKEATSLWKIWKDHDGKIENNKIAIDKEKYSEAIGALTQKSLIEGDANGTYALTDKGKKLLRSIILTTEVNTFEKNAQEPNEIDMATVQKKIHGSQGKKIKKASNQKSGIGKDWYFEAVKDINKKD